MSIHPEPGVVDDHPRSAVELVLDCHWGEAEVLVEGTDLVKREHHPEAGFNEVCILVPEEVAMEGGRRVSTMFSSF